MDFISAERCLMWMAAAADIIYNGHGAADMLPDNHNPQSGFFMQRGAYVKKN